MSFRERRYHSRRPTRPLWRTLIDAFVFAAVLLMVAVALERTGLIGVETGPFSVVDGDSLEHGSERLRLEGIDAPELNQICQDSKDRDYPCGKDARKALQSIVGNNELSCLRLQTDRYGRKLATCKKGNLDINREIILQGWAVAYLQHSLRYAMAEREARDARRGIWAGTFEQPEEYRRRHRLVQSGVTSAAEDDE